MRKTTRASPPIVRAAFGLSMLVVGCYQSHRLPSTVDAGPTPRPDLGLRVDAGTCNLSGVTCSVLPGCLGARPAETIQCDEVRVCLASDPGDVMATAIAAVAHRIRCTRADSCDFLCFIADGSFDDEVRSELCAITRVAPAARIDCALSGP